MGGSLGEELERSGGQSPGPLRPGSLLSSQAGSSHSKASTRLCGSWGHSEGRGVGGADQERQAGGALREEQERSVEGVCPTHSGMGSLLNSQTDPLMRLGDQTDLIIILSIRSQTMIF